MGEYRTTPEQTERMPKGVSYIVGNEFSERFSYYGMRSILMVFMMQHLVTAAGTPDTMSEAEASGWIHTFGTAVYFTPLLGGLLADLFLGKYRTIIWLSIVYCLGHLALAMNDTRAGLAVGLGLIALGAGGIKPCVSSHVGDQFGSKNGHLLVRIFFWFYFSINLGSAMSMWIVPWLLKDVSAKAAFGLPGILMLIATIVFWLGRKKFAHIQPDPAGFKKEAFSKEGLKTVGRLMSLYVFVAMFWALFDQTMSRWISQAEAMDCTVFGIEVLPSQFQAVNPIFVMVLIPLFGCVIYPMMGRLTKVTAMKKIGIGFFVAVPSFGIPALVQGWIDGGATPTIWWQILAYFVLTMAEVMISITALEYSYSQAPPKLKSWIMGLFYSSVALGNFFTAMINFAIEGNWFGIAGIMEGAGYYWFFTVCILVTAILFCFVAGRFKEKAYLQDGTVVVA